MQLEVDAGELYALMQLAGAAPPLPRRPAWPACRRQLWSSLLKTGMAELAALRRCLLSALTDQTISAN